jgi:hypothetical protein
MVLKWPLLAKELTTAARAIGNMLTRVLALENRETTFICTSIFSLLSLSRVNILQTVVLKRLL